MRNNARGTEENDFETPHCSFEFGQIPLETNYTEKKRIQKAISYFLNTSFYTNIPTMDHLTIKEIVSQNFRNVQCSDETNRLGKSRKRFDYWWKSNDSK